MIGDFLLLKRVKCRLIEGSFPSTQAFVYFCIITSIDNLQLGVLQVWPFHPTRWTPLAVWGSLFESGVFLIAAYLLNGGSAGRDFLTRYFAICAVVALWIAVPFQTLIWLPHIVPWLAGIDWYNPAVVFVTNTIMFPFLALQIHDVAGKSRVTA